LKAKPIPAPEASCEKKCVYVTLTAKFSSPFSSSPCNGHNRNSTETQTPEKLGKKGEESPFFTLLHPSSPFEINTTETQPQLQKGEKGEEKKGEETTVLVLYLHDA